MLFSVIFSCIISVWCSIWLHIVVCLLFWASLCIIIVFWLLVYVSIAELVVWELDLTMAWHHDSCDFTQFFYAFSISSYSISLTISWSFWLAEAFSPTTPSYTQSFHSYNSYSPQPYHYDYEHFPSYSTYSHFHYSYHYFDVI